MTTPSGGGVQRDDAPDEPTGRVAADVARTSKLPDTNEWLVYEIHQQYLHDPETVSPEWREFLSDAIPDDVEGTPVAVTVAGSRGSGKSAAFLALALAQGANDSVPSEEAPEPVRVPRRAVIPLTDPADVARRDELRRRMDHDLAQRKANRSS